MSAPRNALDLLNVVADALPLHADELRELDAKLGDGDLGYTVQTGCAAMKAALPDLESMEPADQLARAGMAFNRAAASTFGVLFATALMRGGRSVKGKSGLDADDVVPIGRAAMTGLMERGKAKVGDKTLLDALQPAIDAFESARGAGKTAPESLDAAVEACAQGVAKTKEMRSRVSRASWVGDRSVGIQDPGATAVLRILESIQRAVHGA